MRQNPVELLAIINPHESGWTKERWRNFVLGSVVAGVGYGLYRDRVARARTGEEMRRASNVYWSVGVLVAVGAYFFFNNAEKRPLEKNKRRLRLADVSFETTSGCGVDGYDAYVDEELIGEIAEYEDEDGYHYRLADEWQWATAGDLEEAQHGLVAEYNMAMFEEHGDVVKNAMCKYFVRIPKKRVNYPKPGSEYYPEGYPLRKAQDFARIGSQTGSSREVRRSRRGGPRVRTYTKGKRSWPRTVEQARNLLPAEVPKKLRAN